MGKFGELVCFSASTFLVVGLASSMIINKDFNPLKVANRWAYNTTYFREKIPKVTLFPNTKIDYELNPNLKDFNYYISNWFNDVKNFWTGALGMPQTTPFEPSNDYFVNTAYVIDLIGQYSKYNNFLSNVANIGCFVSLPVAFILDAGYDALIGIVATFSTLFTYNA